MEVPHNLEGRRRETKKQSLLGERGKGRKKKRNASSGRERFSAKNRVIHLSSSRKQADIPPGKIHKRRLPGKRKKSDYPIHRCACFA